MRGEHAENFHPEPNANQDEAEDMHHQSNDSEELTEDENDCDCDACRDNLDYRQDDSFVFQGTETFAEQNGLHERLVPALEITKFEVFLMILTLCMRHGLTGPFIKDLLKFVNTLVGSDAMPTGKHSFQQLFSVNSKLTFHFVCDNCNLYLGKHISFEESTVECDNCGTVNNVKVSSLNEGSFFITLPVRDQLQDLIDRAGNSLQQRRNEDDNKMSDFHNGTLYKDLHKRNGPLASPHALSLTMSTDGGQVFENSCRNSLWPVQLICNELPLSERFKQENMILSSLWFGKNSPEMSAFLKPLSEEMKEIQRNGLRRVQNDGTEIRCPAYIVMCVCDSVAKPKVQNIVQFNGYFGCGYCVQPGTLIDETTQIRYPFSENGYALRTQASVTRAMTIAQETATPEMGVKGLSSLTLFPTVHLVFRVPVDYLHCLLFGVTKRLVGLWFDEASHGKRYYIKKFEGDIDEHLSGVVLPSRIATRPKMISKRSQWKGKDWGNFLLYYGIPCLKSFLPTVYLDNFKDLSSGLYLLLKDTITEEELQEADRYLKRFVKSHEQLYGDINMVFNIHLVTHLVDIVRKCGPLFVYSAFCFESGLGLLTKLVRGTQSVASQICRKFIAAKSLPTLLSKFEIRLPVQDFCETVATFNRNKTSVAVGDVNLMGYENLHHLTEEERMLFQERGYMDSKIVSTYNRAIFRGKTFTSRAYTRPFRTNDTCVLLACGYGIIDNIVYLTKPVVQCIAIVTRLRICPDFNVTNHIHTCAGIPYAEKLLVNFDSIAKKCLFFKVGQERFVCERPNEFEKD